LEPLVREALAASVKGNPERFQEALSAFPNEQAAADGLRLAHAIANFALLRQFGHQPNEDEITELAADIAQSEAWSTLTAPDIASVLRGMFSGREGESLEPEVKVSAPFIIAAFALGSAVEPPKWWFEYLDEIEAVLERQ
jgi:hypothetical protein